MNIDSLVKLLYTIGAFILSSFSQAGLGITQYFLQHSLNLKLFGEIDLSPQIQNVAKIVVNSEKYIRAYGTFPHANIFGGFIFIGLMLLLAVYFGLLFKKHHNCSTWNNLVIPRWLHKMFHVEHSELFLLPLLILTFIGLVLSFSRSAWLAFIIGCLIFGVFIFRNVPRGTLRKSSFVRPFCLLLFGIITIIVIFFPKIMAKTSQFDRYEDKALSGRIEYSQIAIKMVKKSPLLGIGYGNFVSQIQNFVDKPLEWWQFQPVHNVFLLILAETGILGLITFIGFVGFCFYSAVRSFSKSRHRSEWANHRGFARSPSQNSKQFEFCDSRTVPRGTLPSDNASIHKLLSICFFAILIGLLVIAQFDHYLWDIQQGALFLWLVLGLTLSCSTWNNTQSIKSKKG